MQEKVDMVHREVYLVNWKKQKDHLEVFDDLKVFVQSYPMYSIAELMNAFAFGKTIFENEDVLIEKKTVISHPKPNFPRVFFWDFNYDRIDWPASSMTVIQRILERSTTTHWQELIRYYGKEAIIAALKEKITYLPDESIAEASLYFNIKKEEMLCYKRKQLQPIHWL